jgi:NAD(P)-dependent dehydrogenase (short-subunit alcohol dehydrogenase family)
MKPMKDRHDLPATYLVTGANRGIGLELARQLSHRGDRVIATARDPERAGALARLKVVVEPLDVADGASVAALARRLSGEAIDVVIHNAAVGTAGPALDRLAVEDVERHLQVNALGPLRVTQALLPNLRAGKRKLIVGITSGLGSISGNTSGGWTAYRISKAALNQLVRSMAADLASEGFICIAISPGWVRTDMGGAGATLTPRQSVAGMLAVLDRLEHSDTSRFFDERGGEVEW